MSRRSAGGRRTCMCLPRPPHAPSLNAVGATIKVRTCTLTRVGRAVLTVTLADKDEARKCPHCVGHYYCSNPACRISDLETNKHNSVCTGILAKLAAKK